MSLRPFHTVYQGSGRVMMKVCVQWTPSYNCVHGPERSLGRRLSLSAIGAPVLV